MILTKRHNMSIIYSFLASLVCMIPGWYLATRWRLRGRKGTLAVFWTIFFLYHCSMQLGIFWKPFNFPLLAMADEWTPALIIAQMFIYPLLVAFELAILHALYRAVFSRGKADKTGGAGESGGKGSTGGFLNREFLALAMFACGAANFVFPFGAYLLERI